MGCINAFATFRTCEMGCINVFVTFRTCVPGDINAFVLDNHAVVTRRRCVTENINAFVNFRTCAAVKSTCLPGAALVKRVTTHVIWVAAHDQRETSMPL